MASKFVWYELMTTDPEGAKRFYGSVVGWTISDSIPGDQDYRMIGRSDGGFAGGVLGLTDEMRQHGARPTWLGYIGVDDVDSTVSKIEAKGGKPTASLVHTGGRPGVKVTGVKVDGDTVTLGVELGATKLTFEGRCDPKDPKRVLGTLSDDRLTLRATLAATE